MHLRALNALCISEKKTFSHRFLEGCRITSCLSDDVYFFLKNDSQNEWSKWPTNPLYGGTQCSLIRLTPINQPCSQCLRRLKFGTDVDVN